LLVTIIITLKLFQLEFVQYKEESFANFFFSLSFASSLVSINKSSSIVYNWGKLEALRSKYSQRVGKYTRITWLLPLQLRPIICKQKHKNSYVSFGVV